jgi:hypothetical protein
VDQLRIKFSQCGLSNSAALESAFQIDCSGEYDDLNSKGDVSFNEIWSCELIKVLDKQRRPINLDIENSLENFERKGCTTYVVDYTTFSRKVIEYMKSSPFSKFGESARPRCDACCPICKALCIEATNHDTRITPHNAIHQPAGIVGVTYRGDPDGLRNLPEQIPNSLIPTTCSQRYALNRSFYLNGDELYHFRDFAKVFPGWKEPLINEGLPLREYIFATYNKEIAKVYHKVPCCEIPRNYFRDFWDVEEQLKMDPQMMSITTVNLSEIFY